MTNDLVGELWKRRCNVTTCFESVMGCPERDCLANRFCEFHYFERAEVRQLPDGSVVDFCGPAAERMRNLSHGKLMDLIDRVNRDGPGIETDCDQREKQQ